MWRDDEWLKFYPLNVHTAIDYFSLSPFYDMNCNNEKAKQQGLQPSAIPQLAPGIEYVLQESQSPLFVVRRQHRPAGEGVAPRPHGVYYILEGSVYQAPTIHAAISARMARCGHSLQQAFTRMQEDLDPAIASERLAQQQDRKDKQAAEAAATAAAAAQRPSLVERDRMEAVDAIIASALRRHGGLQPVPAAAASASAPAHSSALPAASVLGPPSRP